MVGTLKLQVKDENEADKLNKVKKFGVLSTTTSTEPKKRAALGDLQNRGVLRTAAGKEIAQKDISAIKLHQGVRNAKPRVDTHWKKSSVSSTAAPSTGSQENVTTAGVVTRSNSLRVAGSGVVRAAKTSATGVSLQRHGSTHLHVTHKQKTLTARVVENKLQQVKHVSKVTKTKVFDEKAPITTATNIKREDSSLSRRSLTKLKAALNRDASGGAAKAVAKIKSESTVSVQKKPEDVPATIASSSIDVKTNELKIVSVQSQANQLIGSVEDIDAGDAETLVLVSEYVNDIYDYFFCLETEQEIRPNHLEGQQEANAKMRAVLIDWINEVHLQFHCIIETFQIAVAIIDRYLQAVKNTKRSQLQLVGVTALFIACKYEELYPPAIADFVFITDNTYSIKQILQMELIIFRTLDCNLSRPLPIQFLRRFSKAGDAQDVQHGMAKYFLELASIEYEMASYKPSEIAAASLFLSLNLLQNKKTTGLNNKYWTPTLEWYSRYTANHLRPIVRKLATIAKNAPSAKLKAVYTKYQSSKLYKVSLRTELYGTLMDSIVSSKN